MLVPDVTRGGHLVSVRDKQAGFTLMELMIVVVIIGILAAIAIPAFSDYMQRARSTEAMDNLKGMFVGAAAYYGREQWRTRAVEVSVSTSAATSHCTVVGATTSAPPDASKSVIDWHAESTSFEHIGFTTRDPVYFQYEIGGGDGLCSHNGSEPLYSFRAYGDLDGDSVTSLYELAAGSSPLNERMRAPGIYKRNGSE